jgi:hypothetical protein
MDINRFITIPEIIYSYLNKKIFMRITIKRFQYIKEIKAIRILEKTIVSI